MPSRNPVEVLAEEYLERFRRGEKPSVAEYQQRFPELAEQIGDVFPALAWMENAMPENVPAEDADMEARQRLPQLRQLGDFRIIREVGRGGMGVVYEAVQESLGRRVALKVLPPQALLDARQQLRFQREARAAASLHHTNIVPVYGVGQQDGLHYFAMQFIDGLGLDDVLAELRRTPLSRMNQSVPRSAGDATLIESPPTVSLHRSAGAETATFVAKSLVAGQFGHRDRPDHDELAREETAVGGTTGSQPRSSGSDSFRLPGEQHESSGARSLAAYWASIARIGVQVADALQYAHDNGVLHRDIKPSNLLLDVHGTVWVADFGLAKAGDQDNLTRTGDIIGTLRYMAPELFNGSGDCRSDVYSLGLTLYELLAMRPAYDESNRQRLIQQVARTPPTPLRSINPAIPRDLATIVEKSIDHDAAGRYQTAADMAADLRRFLAGEPIRARPLGYAARLTRWCLRNPRVASLTTAVALLLLTIGIGGLSWAMYAEQARQQLAAEQVTATRRLYDSFVASARASRQSGRPGQRLASLQALREAAALRSRLKIDDADRLRLRNEAIAAMGLVDLREFAHFRIPVPDGGVECDPEARTFACMDEANQLGIWRIADGQKISTLPISVPPSLYPFRSFLADGRYLIGIAPWPAGWIWDLRENKFIHRFKTSATAIRNSCAICGQGGLAAWIAEDGSVEVFDLKTATCLHSLETRAQSLAMAPDASKLAVASAQNTGIEIWDCQTGRPIRVLNIPLIASLAWHPSGKYLACAGGSEYEIQVWDVETGICSAVLRGHRNGGNEFQFSVDGAFLASAGWDGSGRLWYPFGDRELLRTQGGQCAFIGTRNVLMMHTGLQVELWDICRSPECRTLYPGDTSRDVNFTGCAFWWDGPVLASARQDGLRVWNLQSHDPPALAPIGYADSVLFHKQTHSLLSSGWNGIYQWPITVGQDGCSWRIGPPGKLHDRSPDWRTNVTLVDCGDGRHILATVGYGAIVLDLAGGGAAA